MFIILKLWRAFTKTFELRNFYVLIQRFVGEKSVMLLTSDGGQVQVSRGISAPGAEQ